MYTLLSSYVDECGPILRIRVQYSYGGWIHAYLDSQTGTLMIASDWGDWTHRWGLGGIPGCGFTSFILDRNHEKWAWYYVADKLMYGREREVLDVKATQSHLRRQLAEAYREQRYGTEIRARMYADAIEDVNSMETFEDVYDSNDIQCFYRVDSEDIRMMPSPEIVQLREFILPTIGTAYANSRTAPSVGA